MEGPLRWSPSTLVEWSVADHRSFISFFGIFYIISSHCQILPTFTAFNRLLMARPVREFVKNHVQEKPLYVRPTLAKTCRPLDAGKPVIPLSLSSPFFIFKS